MTRCFFATRQKSLRRFVSMPVLVTCLLAEGLAGCADKPQPLTPLSKPQGMDDVADRTTNGRVSPLDGATQDVLKSYGRMSGGGNPAQAHMSGPDVTLNFAGTDIRTVIDEILGNILHLNYTVESRVSGSATLRTVQPLRRDQLLPVLRGLLAGNGAGLIEDGGVYHVVVAQQGPGRGAGANTGQTTIPLRYVAAQELAKTLQPFMQNGGYITGDASTNTVIVGGDAATRQALVELVQSFDIDTLAGQSYALLPTSTGNAQELASALRTALGAQSGGSRASEIRITPLARIDSILVAARTPRLLADAQRLFSLIEEQRRKTVRIWNIYYLQNNRANDVAYVLQQAFTPNHVTATPTAQKTEAQSSGFGGGGSSAGSAFGNTGQNSFGAFGSTSMGNSLSGLGNGGNSAFGSGNTTSASSSGRDNGLSSTNPLSGGLDAQDQGGSSDDIRIIPDLQNNAILIYATPDEDTTINNMLHKLDIMPLQVRIDATIAEVTLNDNLKYGTQFFFKSGGVNGILSNAAQSLTTETLANAALSSTFPGFVIGGASGGGAPFVVNLLQNITTVQVLSSPQLMVTDNEPASLMVGNLVPYLNGTTTGVMTTNSTITNSISYQPTGVIMQVTPRISNNGLVTLDISQQVSSVQSDTTSTSSGSINSPTFSERQVTSRVTVADGQTVGLAGLITDNRQRGNSGIPWLKDIPVLGLLGGTQTNVRSRTELLVLVTPHVIHSQTEAWKLTEDMREQVHHAAEIPDLLNHTPASGSSDPQHRVLHGLGLRD